MKLPATINNIKTVISFTTGSQDITKPDSIVKLSEGATCSKKENLEKSSFIGSFLLKDLTKAEIRCCMRTIMKQSGYNSCKKLEGLVCDMFPDSKIAEEFALCRPKASHVIYHGLSPFYKKKISNLLQRTLNNLILYQVLMKLLSVFQIKNSVIYILLTLMNTCKEHRDCISILNLWVKHKHLT